MRLHARKARFARERSNGFTLVELVVTLTISIVVVSFASMFVSAPIAGFVDQARRMRLVDAADAALRRMSRDVRLALPNSVRTTASGGVVALELLGTVDGARYREQAPGTAAQILDLTATDTSFNVIGPFTQIAKPFSSTSHHLAIYNVGAPGADAYELANVITPAGTSITIDADTVAGEDRVTLSPGFRFAYGSPTRRVFLIDAVVSYLCDPITATLTRYSGYTIAPDHADRDSSAELLAAGASASLMADRIGGCAFTYAPGTAERAGLVTLEVTITEQSELVRLLAQVHVDNVP